MPADAAWARLDEFRCVATTSTPVPCNWKAVADGFSETYHVQGLHREMLGSIDDVHAPQHLWVATASRTSATACPAPGSGATSTTRGVGLVRADPGRPHGPDPWPARPMPPVPEGQTVRDVIAELLRGTRRSSGPTWRDLDTDAGACDLAQYNLFPNATVLLWGR